MNALSSQEPGMNIADQPTCRPFSPSWRGLLPTLALVAAAGCGEPAAGTLEVRVYGEEFIEEGIPADELSDGWAVSFDRFLVTVGPVQVAAGHGAAALSESGQRIYDLALPTMGKGTLVATKMVGGGDYDHVTYEIAPARAGATAGNTLEGDALDSMVRAGEALRVVGSATRAGKTVRFSWGFPGAIEHACHVQKTVDGGTATAEITIHGDHLFHDDLVAAEPDLAFDLIATSDSDGDGTVTQAELTARTIGGQARYQVGNFDVKNLWAFIAHQAGTVGHIDGEGHCETVSH
jgi:hypothetical protein